MITSNNYLKELIYKVTAEYFTDSDDLDEATTETTHLSRDFRARLLFERDFVFLVTERILLTTQKVSVGVVSKYNVRTDTFSGRSLEGRSCPKGLYFSHVSAIHLTFSETFSKFESLTAKPGPWFKITDSPF